MYIHVCIKCEKDFRTNDEQAETCLECNQDFLTGSEAPIDHSDVPYEYEIRDYRDDFYTDPCPKCRAPYDVECDCD